MPIINNGIPTMYNNWRWLTLRVDGSAWAINENSTASNRKIMINGSEFFQIEIIFFITNPFLNKYGIEGLANLLALRIYAIST